MQIVAPAHPCARGIQFILNIKKGRRFSPAAFLNSKKRFTLDHLKSIDAQVHETATHIGAVPNKYLFCQFVRFHGSAIFCLF
jgi:hypothetical protein